MNKKIISLIITLAFVAVAVFALVSATGSYALEITDIALREDGRRVAGLGEGTYEIEVYFKALASVENPYVAVLLCEGTEERYNVVDFASDASLVLAEGEEGSIKAEIKCENPENSFIKIITTKEEDSSKRVAANGSFPTGNELKLASVEISGKAVEGFDKDIFEYTHTVEAGTALPPEVSITQLCNDAEAEVTVPEELPGVITVTLTYKDYESVVYKINVIKAVPKATIVSIGETSKSPSSYEVVNNIQQGTILHNGNTREITDFGGTGLEGATIIRTYFSDFSTGKEAVTDNFVVFDIDGSAEIYIGSYMNPVPSAGYLNWLSDFALPYTDESGNQFIMMAGGHKLYMHKSEPVTVEPGGTERISLKSVGNYGNGMYAIFIKWLD